MRISLAFENKFDSARLNENVTDFIFCMNNFCCGSKHMETKINLKDRSSLLAGRGQPWKKRKMISSPRKNLPIPTTEVVFINWKIT